MCSIALIQQKQSSTSINYYVLMDKEFDFHIIIKKYLFVSYQNPTMSNQDSISIYLNPFDDSSIQNQDNQDQFSSFGENLLTLKLVKSQSFNLASNQNLLDQMNLQNILHDQHSTNPLYQEDSWFNFITSPSQHQLQNSNDDVSTALNQQQSFELYDNSASSQNQPSNEQPDSMIGQNQGSTHSNSQRQSSQAKKSKKQNLNKYKNCKNQLKKHFLNLLKQTMEQKHGSYKFYQKFVRQDQVMKKIVFQIKDGKRTQKKSGNEMELKQMLGHQKLKKYWTIIRQNQAIGMQIMGSKYRSNKYKMMLIEVSEFFMSKFCQ